MQYKTVDLRYYFDIQTNCFKDLIIAEVYEMLSLATTMRNHVVIVKSRRGFLSSYQ